MIVVDRRRLFPVFGLLSAALIPCLFLAFPAPELPAAAVPALLVAEALVYMLSAWMHNPAAGLRGAGVAAILLLAARLGINFIIAIFVSWAPDISYGGAWLVLHLGNPLSMFLQMAILLLLAPHVFYEILPGLLSNRAALQMAANHAPADHTARVASPAPIGGVMQVATYEELSDFFRKIVGLEGFMIYSDEGLNLWSNFELQMNEDAAAAATNQLGSELRQWTHRLRLQPLDRMLFQTEERSIFNMPLTDHACLLLLFTAQTPLEDVWPRIDILRRTAREFLLSRGDMR